MVWDRPRRAANLRNAKTVSGVDNDPTSSKWTLHTTAQVNNNTQYFFLGLSQQNKGPAWSKPATANGNAWETLSAGKGGIGWEQGCESWRWQETHDLFTCLAIRRTLIIQNPFPKEAMIRGTPACFNKWCWKRTKRTLRWHWGKIMGCFSARDNAENCKRPWTLTNPSVSIKGVNFASADDLDTGRPSSKALISSANSYLCTHWMSLNLASVSSSNVNSPWRRSGDLELAMKRSIQATTRIAFHRLSHLSTSRSFSFTCCEVSRVTLKLS